MQSIYFDLKFKRKYPQHPLADLPPPFFAYRTTPFAKAGFQDKMDGIQTADRFPIKTIGAIQENFGCVQFTLQRTAQSAAKKNIDPVKCRMRQAASIGENNAGMRSLRRKVVRPDFPWGHDQ
jgi:hypothetical protein